MTVHESWAEVLTHKGFRAVMNSRRKERRRWNSERVRRRERGILAVEGGEVGRHDVLAVCLLIKHIVFCIAVERKLAFKRFRRMGRNCKKTESTAQEFLANGCMGSSKTGFYIFHKLKLTQILHLKYDLILHLTVYIYFYRLIFAT